MSDDDFGSGDFTLEGWFPALKPGSWPWTHVVIERDPAAASPWYMHATEEFEGVLFVSVRTYGADGRLEAVQLTRADLVRG